MLRRNPAGRAVLHQAHTAEVRHLGTAHAVIDPTHHVAQDALRIVLHLADHLLAGPPPIRRQWNVQKRGDIRAPAARLQRLLHLGHIHLVIMQRVQHSRRWRRHPGAIGPGARMLDLHLDHLGHRIGFGPHPLADLRLPAQPAFQTDIHVLVLVSANPRLALDEILAAERPGFHRRVNLIARAIEKTGIDERNPVLGRADAFLEVHRRPPLLIHDAELDGVLLQSQRRLDPREDLIAERHFVRPVHLGLHHIDTARNRIAAWPR